MKWRIWSLPALMGVLLSAIYFLPESKEMAPSAIRMQLPDEMAGWIFQHKAATEEEIKILAADTQFAKAVCLKARAGEYDPASGDRVPDRIDLSVVFSGHDLNNSIHRPERCMPAQGHALGLSSKAILKLPNGHQLPVRRLLSVQSMPTNEERTEYASFQSVTYYFFVGQQMITEDHFARTVCDMKDRLLFGMDQQWAYVSASMWYGKVPWIEKNLTIEEADQKLQQFLIGLSTEQIDWKQIEK